MPLLFLFAAATVAAPCRADQGPRPGTGVDYSLVYIIHGDADYLYHDASGDSQQGDEKAVRQARWVGRNASRGEVLIFYLRPERKILGIFPRKDRLFLHYRGGELIRKERYSPRPDTALNPFGAETALYERFRARPQETRRVLLYFGHEIPVGRGAGYHLSRPGVSFNRERFVEGVARFAGDDKFDLLVLSTCENGTPAMAALLKPHGHTLLASPQNLHLSHIDSRELVSLDRRPGLPSDSLAIRLARPTYDRLTRSIHTVISLSVYQLDSMNYLDDLSDLYFVYRSTRDSPGTGSRNVDCARLPFFREERFTRGVTVFYRPPRFGPHARKEHHSGWGCRGD